MPIPRRQRDFRGIGRSQLPGPRQGNDLLPLLQVVSEFFRNRRFWGQAVPLVERFRCGRAALYSPIENPREFPVAPARGVHPLLLDHVEGYEPCSAVAQPEAPQVEAGDTHSALTYEQEATIVR